MKDSWKLFIRLTSIKEFFFLNIPLFILKLLLKNSLGVEWTHWSSIEKLSFEFEENSFRRLLGYEKKKIGT